ncbi:MAG TPA: zinc-dependent peptidase, partial [Actinomycetota bacterium]
MKRWRRRLTGGAIDDAAAADASIRAVVAQRLPAWQHLDDAERDRLVDITIELVREVRWEAARGFELTDEMVLTIAAHAALPVLELGAERYRDVSTIIV